MAVMFQVEVFWVVTPSSVLLLVSNHNTTLCQIPENRLENYSSCCTNTSKKSPLSILDNSAV